MRPKSSSIGGGEEELPPPLKLVFVGDSGVGKTTLLSSYRKGAFHDNLQEGQHTQVLEGFTKPVVVNEKEYICLLWDTIGSPDFDRLRPLSYPKTDCFVICFAINDKQSFNNLKEIWIPEILAHTPEIPFIFASTKMDVKETETELITPEEISALVESTEAYECVECDSKDMDSILNVFKASVKAIFAHEEKLKAIKDANSQSFCVIC